MSKSIGVSSWFPLFIKKDNILSLPNEDFCFCDQRDSKSFSERDFFVSWGENVKGVNHCVLETGFFKNAAHFDSKGLYQKSSLSSDNIKDNVSKYEAKINWRDLKKSGKINSKFGQPKTDLRWDGVVLACQHPNDRSILSVGSTKDYYSYIEKVSSFYKSKLFLKRHPVTSNNKEDLEILEGICKKHGSNLGFAGDSIIEDCEAVHLYNSTYAVDAVLKMKTVYQNAPGYFWKSGIVSYTGGTIFGGDSVDFAYADRFIDFLLWKYCFHMEMAVEKLRELILLYSSANYDFPMREEFSYASFLLSKT